MEELEKVSLLRRVELGKGVPRLLGLLAVPEDDLRQIDAAPVVTECPLCPNSPERPRQELLLQGPIPVALVEVGAQVVALEVREDVLDQERLELRFLQRRKPASVVHRIEKRRRRRKEVVQI